MAYFDQDEYRKKVRWVWFAIIGAIWMIFCIAQGNAAYNKATAETAKKTGFDKFWSSGAVILNSDADSARMGWIVGGVFGLVGVFFLANFIAGTQAGMKQDAIRRGEERQAERAQQQFAEQLESLDQESNRQADLSKLAQSKRELITRLGTIDQYIRVLGVESDVSQRTVALQAAHSEMTTLAAKLSSGQISRDAIEDAEVREQAAETSHDLASLGLSDDRLNRDLVRMFKLGKR